MIKQKEKKKRDIRQDSAHKVYKSIHYCLKSFFPPAKQLNAMNEFFKYSPLSTGYVIYLFNVKDG